jgi:phospholipid/cholesterol/gamma-HCH transport system substrate-binding protein
MKISNETKIGALTAISITLLILGFNFLKGKNLFQKKATMYITFKKVEGLNVSDAIKINGLRVGAVEGMQEQDPNLKNVVVAFHLTRDINIPVDSYGKIEAAPLGATYIVINMGKSDQYLKNGDSLRGVESPGLVQDLKAYLVPTIDNANQTLLTIDSAVKKIGSIFDEKNKKNLGDLLAHLNGTLELLNNELTPATGSLAQLCYCCNQQYNQTHQRAFIRTNCKNTFLSREVYRSTECNCFGCTKRKRHHWEIGRRRPIV